MALYFKEVVEPSLNISFHLITGTWSHHSLSLGNVVLAGQKYKQLVRLQDKIKNS